MIRAGFLSPKSRRDLIELARDGSAAHRLARRANALLLLDQGMSCGEVAKVLFLDDDTIRSWYRLYQEDGFDGLATFGYDGSACRLSEDQQDKLKAWITETLPHTTSAVGACRPDRRTVQVLAAIRRNPSERINGLACRTPIMGNSHLSEKARSGHHAQGDDGPFRICPGRPP